MGSAAADRRSENRKACLRRSNPVSEQKKGSGGERFNLSHNPLQQSSLLSLALLSDLDTSLGKALRCSMYNFSSALSAPSGRSEGARDAASDARRRIPAEVDRHRDGAEVLVRAIQRHRCRCHAAPVGSPDSFDAVRELPGVAGRSGRRVGDLHPGVRHLEGDRRHLAVCHGAWRVRALYDRRAALGGWEILDGDPSSLPHLLVQLAAALAERARHAEVDRVAILHGGVVSLRHVPGNLCEQGLSEVGALSGPNVRDAGVGRVGPGRHVLELDVRGHDLEVGRHFAVNGAELSQLMEDHRSVVGEHRVVQPLGVLRHVCEGCTLQVTEAGASLARRRRDAAGRSAHQVLRQFLDERSRLILVEESLRCVLDGILDVVGGLEVLSRERFVHGSYHPILVLDVEVHHRHLQVGLEGVGADVVAEVNLRGVLDVRRRGQHIRVVPGGLRRELGVCFGVGDELIGFRGEEGESRSGHDDACHEGDRDDRCDILPVQHWCVSS